MSQRKTCYEPLAILIAHTSHASLTAVNGNDFLVLDCLQ